MTNEELMQLMTEMGLHEGGMENWVPDNAWLLVANRAIEIEREACAKLCEDKAMRLETKAQEAIEAGEHGEVNAIRSTAWQISVCAAEIRARGRNYGRESMGKVIPFKGITKLDLDPDMILENTKGKLDGFVIMGWDKEGEEYFASTYADGGTVLWLVERMKKQLLEAE